MQHCSYCGVDNYQLEGKCRNCGAALSGPEPVEPPPTPPPPIYQDVINPVVPIENIPPNRGPRVLLSILAGVLVLLIFNCLIPWNPHNTVRPSLDTVVTSGKWALTDYSGRTYGGTLVLVENISDNVISASKSRAKLTCGCTDGTLASFIDIGPRPEKGRRDSSLVTLIFDDDEPLKQYWTKSAESIYPPDTTQLFEKLRKSKSFRLEFMPVKGEKDFVVFDVTGFDVIYQRLIKACPNR